MDIGILANIRIPEHLAYLLIKYNEAQKFFLIAHMPFECLSTNDIVIQNDILSHQKVQNEFYFHVIYVYLHVGFYK